jgi:NAD(P)-dependent dehydrogenase (short-subunit alcohol dehydrogenase family)
MDLNGKVAIITVRVRGISRATRCVAREGRAIVVADANEKARGTVKQVERQAGGAAVRTDDEVRGHRRDVRVRGRTCGSDILYNNMACTGSRRGGLRRGQWRRTIDIAWSA